MPLSSTHTAIYEDWSLAQSAQFLKEQGVAVKDSDTLAELQAQVANYADKAATVSVSRATSHPDHRADVQWGAAAAGAGQAYFEVGSKKALDT